MIEIKLFLIRVMAMPIKLAAVVFLGVGLLWNCAKKPSPPKSTTYDSEPASYTEDTYDLDNQEVSGWLDNPSAIYALDVPEDLSLEESSASPSARRRPTKSKTSSVPAKSGGASGSHEMVEPASSKDAEPVERMVHYSGSITLKAANPKKILDSAAHYVKSLDGYVERLQGITLVLRVPAARFQTVFDSLLQFAGVVRKTMWAEDITEAFKDNELRGELAKATLGRLTALLEKAEKDKDKMWILREIQRVREALEKLEEHRKWLENQADFGRITLTVEPYHRHLQTTYQDIAGFLWIRRLSPSVELNPRHHHKIEFPVPDEMVLIDNPKIWKAVSADGAKVWAQSIENEPEGDTDFWVEAVEKRLKEDYASVTRGKAGTFTLLRFVPPMENPHVYYVGVRRVEKKLEIVEIFYPSEAQEQRYHGSVVVSLEKGKV